MERGGSDSRTVAGGPTGLLLRAPDRPIQQRTQALPSVILLPQPAHTHTCTQRHTHTRRILECMSSRRGLNWTDRRTSWPHSRTSSRVAAAAVTRTDRHCAPSALTCSHWAPGASASAPSANTTGHTAARMAGDGSVHRCCRFSVCGRRPSASAASSAATNRGVCVSTHRPTHTHTQTHVCERTQRWREHAHRETERNTRPV
jgi:hypothetical protein